MPDITCSADVTTMMAAADFAGIRSTLSLSSLAMTVPGTGVPTALQVNIGTAGAFVVLNGAGGTPTSMVGTNITGTAAGLTAGVASAVAVGGITGAGTGVLTALAVNIGSAGAPVLFNGAGGTPSSLTLTNATGLPTAGIVDDSVTLAKIQNAAANSKLIGSGATGSGANYVEITLGTGLSMSGTTLNVSAGAGDVTQAVNASGANHVFVSGGADKSRVETPVTIDPGTGNMAAVGNITGSGLVVTTFGVLDTDQSHQLQFAAGSNLTANRILTFTTGDAARNVTIQGDVTLPAGTALVSGGAAGTPSSITLTNGTGLPASGIAAGVLGGTITLGEGTGNVLLDNALSADGTWSGVAIAGTAGATLAFGDIIYFSVTDSRWELADADAASTAGDVMLGICVLAAAADGSATTVLLQGMVRADAVFPTFTIGSPVYVGTTAGDVQVAQPSGTDDVIRVAGYGFTADVLYFNPSGSYITHT